MQVDRHTLERFFMNEASQEEITAISKWARQGEANRKEFTDAYNEHILTTLTISKIHLGADMLAEKQRMSAKRTGRIAAYISGIAAALLLGAFMMWQFATSPLQKEASKTLAFETAPGQRASVILPDGTTVSLNSDTRLEYPSIFSKKERHVRIDGEAMFEVSKDATRPFYVETYAYNVKVLGTKFNIIAEKAADEFVTALIEGHVAITDKNDTQVAELLPNQLVTLKDGRLHKSEMENIAGEYRWTEGIISCSGLGFEELMRKFERAFGVRIVIDRKDIPEVGFRRMKINVQDGIVHAFKLLQRSADFIYEYDETDGTYHIK